MDRAWSALGHEFIAKKSSDGLTDTSKQLQQGAKQFLSRHMLQYGHLEHL